MINRQSMPFFSQLDSFAATVVLATVLFCAPQLFANTREIAELPADRQVVFSRDIAPVLLKNCVACHNASTEEGGVNLESVAKMQASEVEDVLVPGNAKASRLFLLASHADDPLMPPDDNDVSASALDPMELALLRRWIESGATVDAAASAQSTRQWQPLPNSVKTVYGSTMTSDGRLSAVSFGNQIRLFGAKSSDPIDSLQRVVADQVMPAHDDFVQDLFLAPDGQRIVSAGFRNVKLWEMAPLETATIPQIDRDKLLSVALSPSGRHVATLSPRGELSVAEVGKNRWQWMKGFDVPADFQSEQPPLVRLAVDPSGDSVAVAWNKMIRIVRIDGKETESIETSDEITSILFRDPDQLFTGVASGSVIAWLRENNVWTSSDHAVSDQPISMLCSATQDTATQDTAPVLAIDVSGKVARWDLDQNKFIDLGKLPAPPVSVSLATSNDSLWLTTAEGIVGTYDLADKKFVEVAKTDPNAAAQYASDEWETLVGEKLVAAQDTSVKQAEANVAAEKKNLETIASDITVKTTAVTEKEKSVADAKQAIDAAETKLAVAQKAEQSATEMRTGLEATVKKLDATIAELTEQLKTLQTEKADADKQLAEIPDAKKLAEEVKVQTEAAEKAAKNLKTKNDELSSQRVELKLAEETKSRAELRLTGLDKEIEHQKESLEQRKTEQEAKKTKAAESKSLRDQSRASDRTLAVLASGTQVLTRSAAPGSWSLWSATGDWLGRLPALPADGELVSAGDGCVLIQGSDGQMHALRISKHVWRQQKTIGSSSGESPFADRVLSVDVDPSGELLATGGGEPSRSGELMIWKIADGSLVRRFDAPHSDTVLCVRFSPDGKTLATGGADRMIKLWDVATGELIKSLEGHTHHVSALAWNVNLRELASGSADSTVKIWDIGSGQSTRTINALKSEVTRLVYIGREDRIGIIGGDGYFQVYRTDNGGRETNAKVPGGYLYALESNRDGTQFVIGGADGKATVVDKSGKQIQELVSGSDEP